jgi:hypothetical protein
MENASKALLIAGAILLAIILISLGIAVVNNGRNQIGGANLSKEQIQTFNSQWEIYVGQRKTAADVKSMYSAAIASNAAEAQSGENRFVNITNGADTLQTTVSDTQPMLTMENPSNAVTYTIQAGYAANGLIVSLDWSTTPGTGE